MDRIRAAVMPAPGLPVELRTLSMPAVEPGGAVLRVLLSEVCGTDVYLHDGRLADVEYPIIPGHVTVGNLESLRGTVETAEGERLRAGDLVTFLDVHGSCHRCWTCLVAKASTRCPHRRVYGITLGLEVGPAGGWAERMYLRPGTRIIRLGEADPERFMAGGCGIPTALHAVERAQIGHGDTVLVLGSGPVGLSVAALARQGGAGRVLVIGGPARRVAVVRRMGADEAIDIGDLDEDMRLDWVRDHSNGRGADVTIEATGVPEAVRQALRYTRDAGRVVIAGQYTDHGDVTINPHELINRKHLDIRGCWGSDYSHFHRAVRLASDPERSLPWAEIPLHRYGLGELNEALTAVRSGEVVKALVDPAS
jgi:L-iditol 2-dehydrogenase